MRRPRPPPQPRRGYLWLGRPPPPRRAHRSSTPKRTGRAVPAPAMMAMPARAIPPRRTAAIMNPLSGSTSGACLARWRFLRPIVPGRARRSLSRRSPRVRRGSVRCRVAGPDAGGIGLLRLWRDADSLVCEVRDRGRLGEPLVGRAFPALNQEDGRGLWMVNRLCDLVQVRSLSSGTIVRLHFRLAS